MKIIKTTDKVSGEEIHLSYADYGQGRPVLLIHGWPLCKEMWEYQLEDLVNAGFRVIKYDRRGFGKSSRPWSRYDYDSLTDDLQAVIEALNLEEVTLVGFSMGGGEIARYFTRYRGEKIVKTVLISTVLPFLLKTDDNQDGVDQSVFDGMLDKMSEDRIGFLDSFGKMFFGVSMLNHPPSSPLLEYYRDMGAQASAKATRECTKAWAFTDFRSDLPAINVPTMVIHGDDDKTVPIEISSDLTAETIANAEYKVYKDAPHGLFYTHRKQLNEDLVNFIRG
jgi:non-heme chloroperoxidase